MCDICCHKRVCPGGPCVGCGISVCRECCKRWLLDERSGDAEECPSCRRPWDAREVQARAGAAFVKQAYRAVRRARCLARERARLPASAELAAHVRRQREATAALDAAIDAFHASGHDPTWVVRIQDLQRVVDDLRRPPGAAHAAVVPCAHAGCAGLVTAAAGDVCTRCERRTCRDCGAAIADAPHADAPHVCDPDLVASRTLIRDECRPCAQCGAPSAKVEGCPVMWCVHCHAFWHWDSGALIDTHNGRFVPHNPDHRAFLASGGTVVAPREIDDLTCGGVPDTDAIRAALMRDFARTLHVHEEASVILSGVHALHMAQHMRLHNFPVTWDADRVGEGLRVSFLLGELDEAGFAHALERLDRGLRFKRDVGHVLATFVLGALDIVQRFCDMNQNDGWATCPGARQGDKSLEASVSLATLADLTNASLEDVGKAHARKPPLLERRSIYDWRWRLPYAR